MRKEGAWEKREMREEREERECVGGGGMKKGEESAPIVRWWCGAVCTYASATASARCGAAPGLASSVWGGGGGVVCVYVCVCVCDGDGGNLMVCVEAS